MIRPARFVIVSGLSGAGKTEAIHCLEDIGFFCVDNLPPTLIPKFAELCLQSGGRVSRVALVVDIRGGEFFEKVHEGLAELDELGLPYEILFLEASDEALVRRFKESRRRHPLRPHGEVLEGIREERSKLQELRGRAHKIIDTSSLTVRQLKEEIAHLYGEAADEPRLTIAVVSFGYKYGLPMDADLIMDVRFLPNPHYVPALRPLTGNDPEVQEFVMRWPVTAEFIGRFASLLEFLIPYYIKEGKTTLMLAIGCTGGMHRSVTLANHLGRLLKEKGHRVVVRHRDLEKCVRHPAG